MRYQSRLLYLAFFICCTWTSQSSFASDIARSSLCKNIDNSIKHRIASYGFVNCDGELTVPCKYDECKDFSEGLAAVTLNGKHGFVDRFGVHRVPCKFDIASSFSEGLACVKINKKVGFIDRNGEFVIKPRFDAMGDFSEGVAGVKLGKHRFYIDHRGKRSFSGNFSHTGNFENGFACVKAQGKRFLIDHTGKKLLTDSVYQPVFSVSEGLVAIKAGLYQGYTGLYNKRSIAPKFLFAYPFCEGRAVCEVRCTITEYKYLVITDTGETVAAFDFDRPTNLNSNVFSEGFLPVYVDQKWGYIDKFGKMAIQPRFNDAKPFKEGVACVKMSGSYGFIDKAGKFVIKPIFSDARSFSDGRAAVLGFSN